MEIPSINIPEIYIPEIYIPEPYNADIPVVTQYLEINPPGCTYQHRDIKNTGNHNLLLDDPNGVYTICDFSFPSFIPPVYNPNQMTVVEEPLPTSNTEPNIPETETPKIPEEEKKDDIVIPECPSSKDQRIGDFVTKKNLNVLQVINYLIINKSALLCTKTYRSKISTYLLPLSLLGYLAWLWLVHLLPLFYSLYGH